MLYSQLFYRISNNLSHWVFHWIAFDRGRFFIYRNFKIMNGHILFLFLENFRLQNSKLCSFCPTVQWILMRKCDALFMHQIIPLYHETTMIDSLSRWCNGKSPINNLGEKILSLSKSYFYFSSRGFSWRKIFDLIFVLIICRKIL